MCEADFKYALLTWSKHPGDPTNGFEQTVLRQRTAEGRRSIQAAIGMIMVDSTSSLLLHQTLQTLRSRRLLHPLLNLLAQDLPQTITGFQMSSYRVDPPQPLRRQAKRVYLLIDEQSVPS